MSSDYIHQVGLTKWLLDGYPAVRSSRFPSGSKLSYDTILLGTHHYLNENVHPTVQQRAPLQDEGVYLTDHGPAHIEIVIRRASQLVQALNTAMDRNAPYVPAIEPYEAFLLTLGIHFHDVGNMYGRSGHEKRLTDVMQNVGPLQPIDRWSRQAIVQIAVSHGGTTSGDRDTIRVVPAILHDGDVSYRLQLLAAILRLADELADEYSRADNFGLLEPGRLPDTCLIFHKYAEGLRVSIDLPTGQIGLTFRLHATDLRTQFAKIVQGTRVPRYLLDEIYERTLKTYKEMIYCGRFMRQLNINFHQVAVTIEVYESPQHFELLRSLSYVIGDTGYPDYRVSTDQSLRWLARGFDDLPNGAKLAEDLGAKRVTE